MPQLAPLNWILLIFFFWSMVLLIIVSIWWMSKKEYRVELKKSSAFVSKNKNWTW